MSSVLCSRKSAGLIADKFSTKKLLKFLKAAKPVIKLMRNKKRRTNAVTPSSCNYDVVVENFQNDANELELFQLDFKFVDGGNEAEDNSKNEELERRLLEKLGGDDGLRPPKETHNGWMCRSDADVCVRGAEYLTHRQKAERQTPIRV